MILDVADKLCNILLNSWYVRLWIIPLQNFRVNHRYQSSLEHVSGEDIFLNLITILYYSNIYINIFLKVLGCKKIFIGEFYLLFIYINIA